MYYKRKSCRVFAEQWFPDDMAMTFRLGISVYQMSWGIAASINGGTPISPGDWVIINDRGYKEVISPSEFKEDYDVVTRKVFRSRLVEYNNEVAICSVKFAEFECPRVEMSSQMAKILRDKGIKPGDFFDWTMTNLVEVYPEDINPNVSQNIVQELSQEENEELSSLIKTSKNIQDNWRENES